MHTAHHPPKMRTIPNLHRELLYNSILHPLQMEARFILGRVPV